MKGRVIVDKFGLKVSDKGVVGLDSAKGRFIKYRAEVVKPLSLQEAYTGNDHYYLDYLWKLEFGINYMGGYE